ncbi:hypothetical protein ACIO6U_02740 [Streptomyces sp. NPDC087422]|uniref:hypothetical protein n=1 Tax=Streptomyces sp. NPDC087422 TaxID=3365786 RepID=UPI00381C8B66
MTAAEEHAAADADYAAAQDWPAPEPVREEQAPTCCTSTLLCPVHDRAFHPGAH